MQVNPYLPAEDDQPATCEDMARTGRAWHVELFDRIASLPDVNKGPALPPGDGLALAPNENSTPRELLSASIMKALEKPGVCKIFNALAGVARSGGAPVAREMSMPAPVLHEVPVPAPALLASPTRAPLAAMPPLRAASKRNRDDMVWLLLCLSYTFTPQSLAACERFHNAPTTRSQLRA